MKTLLYSLVIACFLTGCSVFIFAEKDETANFSKYHTFGWHPKNISPDSEKSLENQVMESNIKNRVNKELENHDFKIVSIDSPDVWIDYKITFQKMVEQVQNAGNSSYNNPRSNFYNPGFYNYGMGLYPMGYSTRSTTHSEVIQEATITFYLIDRKSKRQVWRGLMADKLKNYPDFEKKIYTSIPVIFKKFPER